MILGIGCVYFAVHVGGTLDPAREEMERLEREYQDLHRQEPEDPSNRIPSVIQNPEDLSPFRLTTP